MYPIDVLRTLQAVEGSSLQLSKLSWADLYRGLCPGSTHPHSQHTCLFEDARPQCPWALPLSRHFLTSCPACMAACVDAFVYHAANFGLYNLLGGLWSKHAPGGLRLLGPTNPAVGLLLGMMAGAAAQWLCCPFTTLTLRMSAAHEGPILLPPPLPPFSSICRGCAVSLSRAGLVQGFGRHSARFCGLTVWAGCGAGCGP